MLYIYFNLLTPHNNPSKQRAIHFSTIVGYRKTTNFQEQEFSLRKQPPHLSKASNKDTLEYQFFCTYKYRRDDEGPNILKVTNYQMPITPIIRSATSLKQGYIPVRNKL